MAVTESMVVDIAVAEEVVVEAMVASDDMSASNELTI